MALVRFYLLLFLCVSCSFAFADAGALMKNPPEPLPVKVDTTFYLWNLNNIDEKDGTFSAELYLMLKWTDKRLAFKGSDKNLIFSETGARDKLKEMWWPEIDFVNATTLETRNRTLSISPSGEIEYSVKVLGSFFNTMDLRMFPFDEQDYEIHIQSFLWDNKSLEFVGNKLETADLANANVRSLRPTRWSAKVTNVPFMSETYSDFGVTVHFVRNPAFFNYQILIPVIIILLIISGMFFLDVSNLSIRLDLALTSILILVAMKFMIHQDLPPVDYLMLVDYIFFFAYFCCCLIIVISCIDYILWKKHQIIATRINRHAVWIPLLVFSILYCILLLISKLH